MGHNYLIFVLAMYGWTGVINSQDEGPCLYLHMLENVEPPQAP